MNASKDWKLNFLRRERGHFSWAILITIAMFLISMGLVFTGWWYTKRVTEKEAKAKFDGRVSEIETDIRGYIRACVSILYDLEALFEASASVDRDEWQAYLGRQKHKEGYPDWVERLDFVAYVKNAERDVFIQKVRSDQSVRPGGYPDFDIHPSGDRGEYFISTYLEPFEGNEKAFGLDHGTYPNRLSAMEQARDLNEPRATGQTILVTDPKKNPAFFIFMPIFNNKARISTVEERQAALKGFVTGIFKIQDLFASIFETKKPFQDIAFKVFEGDELNQYLTEDRLIYQYRPPGTGDSAEHPRFSTLVSLNVAGRIWTMHFYTTPQFSLSPYYELLPLFVLLGGVAFSILVFAFLYSLVTSQSQAVQIAQKMTHQLRESEERFRSVAQSANDAIITADSMGNIIAWNKGAEKIFGYPEELMLGKPLTSIMPERFRKAHSEGIKRMNTTGETHVIGKSVELVGLKKDGSEFPIEVSLSSWKTNRGIFFAGILRDITERKHAQEILVQKTEELIKTNTELERFNRVAVGREMKMIELKREINELCRKLGREAAYDLSFTEGTLGKGEST